jgi:CBS domain-containing membrane protein
VAINSVILVLLGLVFHRLAKRNYPHRPAPVANPHKTADVPPAMRVGFNKQDIDSALSEFNETLDIDREDLDRILRTVEAKALNRTHAELTCADIMSRDVVSVSVDDGPAIARRLLLEHDIRTLPVLDGEKQLVGTVGLRELAGLPDDAPMPMSPAATASPDAPAVSLLPSLTDGRSHAVVITGENGAVAGIVSQTDLLAALAKSLAVVRGPDEAMIDGRGI